jgi:hypothetical protein
MSAQVRSPRSMSAPVPFGRLASRSHELARRTGDRLIHPAQACRGVVDWVTDPGIGTCCAREIQGGDREGACPAIGSPRRDQADSVAVVS